MLPALQPQVYQCLLVRFSCTTLPNKALQPTASSVRSCVAPAFGSG
jgi:hypothetical protein